MEQNTSIVQINNLQMHTSPMYGIKQAHSGKHCTDSISETEYSNI